MKFESSDITLDDALLSERLKNGDEKAFEVIYQKYHQLLYTIAYQYLKSQPLAKDAVQDVFLKLWEKRQQLNTSLPVKGFLHTCLRNHLLNTIRNHHKALLKNLEASYQTPASASSTYQDVRLSECEALFEKGIADLSERKRQIFTLHIFQGLTHEEIAEKLSIAKSTVKLQIIQSTRILRSLLKEYAEMWLILITFTRLF